MMKKIYTKLKLLIRSKQIKCVPSGQSFRQKCQHVISQHPFKDSSYFTTHLPLILQPQSITAVFEPKVEQISKGIQEKPTYEIQLASIILNITQEDGLFYIFIKLWVNFCQFELTKMLHLNDPPEGSFIQLSKVIDIDVSHEKSKTKAQICRQSSLQNEKNTAISEFVQRQFFLLCYFIHQLCLYLYKSSFSKQSQFSAHQLFLLVRNNITCVREWSGIHEMFRKHVKCKCQDFTEKEIGENMAELQKICQISKIPAPFLQSINILNEFNKMPQIQDKLKKCVLLIQRLKMQMQEYRAVNGMKKGHVFCADDVLSALTFAMWRLRKNIYGACRYVEVILCCEFQTIDEERLAQQLDKFGQNARHSFDTVKSVARIGLLEEDRIYTII